MRIHLIATSAGEPSPYAGESPSTHATTAIRWAVFAAIASKRTSSGSAPGPIKSRSTSTNAVSVSLTKLTTRSEAPDRQEQSFEVGESTQSHRVLQQVNSVRRGRRMPAPEQQAYPANWTRYTRAIRRSRWRVSASPHLPSSEVSIERAKSDSSCACNALGSHRILAAKDKKLCSTT